MLAGVALCQGSLVVRKGLHQCGVRTISSHWDWDGITDGRPKRIIAGDTLVSGSIEFL